MTEPSRVGYPQPYPGLKEDVPRYLHSELRRLGNAINDHADWLETVSGGGGGPHTHDAADVISGTFDAARIPNLDASKLTSGVLNSARIPALSYAPVVHTHSASDITSGTLDEARIPALDYAATTHTHAASEIVSGTIDAARLGSGTANATSFLRGDQTWSPWLPRTVRLHRSTNLSVTNATSTLIPSWDEEALDDVGAHSPTTNPSRITGVTGFTRIRVYLFTTWDNNSSGSRQCHILKNSAGVVSGANMICSCIHAPVQEGGGYCDTGWMTYTPGDYFEASVYQNSGGIRTLSGPTPAWGGRSYFAADFA
jgi:hypothetical protein